MSSHARAIGYAWTGAQCKDKKEHQTYHVDQVFTQLALGCARHATFHSHCTVCNTMHATDAELATSGGLSSLVVIFCIQRHPGQNGMYVLERMEVQMRVIPSHCWQNGEDCKCRLSSAFEELCHTQIKQLITRNGMKMHDTNNLISNHANLSMLLHTPDDAPVGEWSMSCGLSCFTLGHTTAPLNEMMEAYTPPHQNYNCGEGGVVKLADNMLSMLLSNIVMIDFICNKAHRRVCIQLHNSGHARTPFISVQIKGLDVRQAMDARVYLNRAEHDVHTTNSLRGVLYKRINVGNLRAGTPFDEHSDMQPHTSSIDRLHTGRHRVSKNVMRWPRHLHAFCGPDDTMLIASRQQRLQWEGLNAKGQLTYAHASKGQLTWASQHMPTHQLYALLQTMQGSTINEFFAVVIPMCDRVSQLMVYGSTSMALQDYLSALYLSYMPAFSALYSIGLDFAFAVSEFCVAHDRSEALQRNTKDRLQKVLETTSFLAQKASDAKAGSQFARLSPLFDFVRETRECLLSEIICDCLVAVFCGGPLSNTMSPSFGTLLCSKAASAELSALDAHTIHSELRARKMHPGPTYTQNIEHARTLLSEHIEEGVLFQTPHVWPIISRLRICLLGGQDLTCEHANHFRQLVKASAEHQHATLGRELHGLVTQTRKRYKEQLYTFMSTLHIAL